MSDTFEKLTQRLWIWQDTKGWKASQKYTDPQTAEHFTIGRTPKWWNLYGQYLVYLWEKYQENVAEPEPNKLHDYTTRNLRWGHNLDGFKSIDPNTMQVWLWGSVRLGDDVRWNTAYGSAEGTIIKMETPRDPGDMHWVTLRTVRRFDRDNKLLTGEKV